MQPKLKDLTLNSSLLLSSATSSTDELLMAQMIQSTRSLPRSSQSIHSTGTTPSIPKRRSEPLPSGSLLHRGGQGHSPFQRNRSSSIVGSALVGSSEVNDLEVRPGNPIRLKQWPLLAETLTPRRSQVADSGAGLAVSSRLIALSNWPLSLDESPERVAIRGHSDTLTPHLIRRNWNCGNLYVPDPVSYHQQNDEQQQPGRTLRDPDVDRIQSSRSGSGTLRSQEHFPSKFALRRTKSGPLEPLVACSPSSSTAAPRTPRHLMTDPCPSDDDARDGVKPPPKKRLTVGKGEAEGHRGLLSRILQFKRNRRHLVTS